MPKTAVVVLANGFEDVEAVAQIDILRRAEIEVTVAGLTGEQIKSSRGMTVITDTVLGKIDFIPDALVLPGGMPGSKNLGESEELKTLAVKTAAAGKIVAAICAAPALTLAAWGLLDGKTATCFPSFEDKFSESTTHSEERVVVDGNIVTSRALGTAIEMALVLAEMLAGKEKAGQIKSATLFR